MKSAGTPSIDPVSAVLRTHLGRVEARRDSLAKEWLICAIRDAPLEEVERLPVGWAARELPDLITELLASLCEGEAPVLGRATLEMARGLGTLRPGLTPSRLAGEIARLQGEMTRLVLAELEGEGADLQGEAAARLSTAFGAVSGEAQEALSGTLEPEDEFTIGIRRPQRLQRRLEHMIEAYRRHGHPFALTLFDVEGPGEGRVDLVARELRARIRTLDETYRLEENELCVLSPFQKAADGAQMAERLAGRLAELERQGKWELTVSAGVAGCPEHGDEAEALLRVADTAMWRARATGRPVAVASAQDR